MIGLIDVARVYTPDPTTGNYTVLAKSDLACRLTLVSAMSVDSGPGRAELVDERRLLWEPSYVLPDTAQVEVSGLRYNVQPGTLAAVRDPSGAVEYRRAKVVKAVT